MSIVEIQYEFYNPRNPKCRACKDWDDYNGEGFVGNCVNKDFKGRKQNRYHNAKACTQFRLKRSD